MKISQTVSYALNAVLQLARGPAKQPVPCSVLAREGNMPERFLLQIMRELVKNGILTSVRGVAGGYLLNRPPQMISLLDVITACDDRLNPVLPEMEFLPASAHQRLVVTLEETSSASRDVLAKLTLADLLEPEETGPVV